jgi:hypothetical protein
MPSIAAYHGVKLDQVIDSLQHYRFGFRQAQNLVSAHGEVSFDPELVGVFTIVHDLGRMMVGSGASAFRYPPEDGNLLHPVVGALMLREAFAVVREFAAPRVQQMLEALEFTAERHTLSIGLTQEVVHKTKLATLRYPPYFGSDEPLFLASAPMSPEFSRYAHLVALADLINNVSDKLLGTSKYQPVHSVGATVPERVDYVINAFDSGVFQVVVDGQANSVIVRRCWSGGLPIAAANLNQIRKAMVESAIRFCSPTTKPIAVQKFDAGWDRAFS